MSEYDFDDDLFGSDDDDFDFASEHPFDDEPLPMPEPEDEIEELRNRTSRGDGIDNDLSMSSEFDDDMGDSGSSSGGFSLDQFSSGQRVVLAIFAFVDVLLVIVGLLLLLNIL